MMIIFDLFNLFSISPDSVYLVAVAYCFRLVRLFVCLSCHIVTVKPSKLGS